MLQTHLSHIVDNAFIYIMTDHNAKQPVTPKDAAAMILLRNHDDPQVFLVKRAKTLAFMANYYAFPGGQRDAGDAETPVLNGDGIDDVVMRVCAIRELFEETGVLIARGAEGMPAKKLNTLRHELNSDQTSFKDLLARQGLALDANLLVEAPRWVTPAHSPRRYNTRFFAAWLPKGQETEVIPGELERGEWLRPKEALQRWVDGDCTIVTPIVFALKALAEGVDDFTRRMYAVSQQERDHLETRIEMCYGFFLCPLRTPTLPPATHTNCYLIGGDQMVIVRSRFALSRSAGTARRGNRSVSRAGQSDARDHRHPSSSGPYRRRHASFPKIQSARRRAPDDG